MKKYKIAFFGTPNFTTEFLDLFISDKCKDFLDLSLIITGQDKPVGRGMQMQSPLPKKWAEKNAMHFFQPKKLDEDFYNTLKTEHEKENFDLFIVIAYGKIIPKNIINLPKYGTINLHYSLLPRYRGASPVESAILDNENETGITIQQMQFELDAGNILFQEKIEILETETTTDLRDKLNKRAIEIFPEFLENLLIHKNISNIKQNETKANFCKKIKKEDLNITNILQNINLNKEEKLLDIFTKWKAYDKKIYFFTKKNNQELRIKITEMEIESRKIKIVKLLPESKKEISLNDFENSYGKILI